MRIEAKCPQLKRHQNIGRPDHLWLSACRSPCRSIPMREHVRLDGILFSRDKQILSVMNQILDSFAIDTEVFAEIGPALDAVTHRRLDSVIVDWKAANNPTRVVMAARRSSPNSNSTIVAMVSGGSEMQAALLAGANF